MGSDARIEENGRPAEGATVTPSPMSDIPGVVWPVRCFSGDYIEDEYGRAVGWLDDPDEHIGLELCTRAAGFKGTRALIDPLNDADVRGVVFHKFTGRRAAGEYRLRALPTDARQVSALRRGVQRVHEAGKLAIAYTGIYTDGRAGGPAATDDPGTIAALLDIGFDEVYFDNAAHTALDCVRLSAETSRVWGVEPTLSVSHPRHQVAHQAAAWCYRPGPWHQAGARGNGRRVRVIVDGRKWLGNAIYAQSMDDDEIVDLVRRRWRLMPVAFSYAVKCVAAVRQVREEEKGGAA